MAKKNSTTTEKTETQQTTDETQQTEDQASIEETTTETGENQTPPEGEFTSETGDGSTEAAGDDTTPPVASDEEEEEVTETSDASVSYASALMESAPEGLGAVGYKLGGYVDEMQSNIPQTESSLQKNQLKLRTVINNVLDLPDDKFGGGMKFLTKVVRDHRKTVFSEPMIFRAFDRLRVSRAERQRLEILISLLLATADVKNPKDVKKSVDMNVVYRFVSDNNQQQKLQSFYGS